MKSIIKYLGPGKYSVLMKKKSVVLLSIVSISIFLGYLFFLSCLFAVLICSCVSGRSAGERGKMRSIIIPLKKYRIHLHHWLCAGCLLVVFSITNIQFLHPMITFGFLGGFVFHGIYFYSDWHRIVIRRHRSKPKALLPTGVFQDTPELHAPETGILQLKSHSSRIERIAALHDSEQSYPATSK